MVILGISNYLGQVITEKRNIYTYPLKKGYGNSTVGHTFSPITYDVFKLKKYNFR